MEILGTLEYSWYQQIAFKAETVTLITAEVINFHDFVPGCFSKDQYLLNGAKTHQGRQFKLFNNRN